VLAGSYWCSFIGTRRPGVAWAGRGRPNHAVIVRLAPPRLVPAHTFRIRAAPTDGCRRAADSCHRRESSSRAAAESTRHPPPKRTGAAWPCATGI